MLFCQPNRTFSCSRVLLSPRSPHRTMVKDVVKTRTPKMQMWSPKNRSRHQASSSSRKEKSRRTKHGVVSPRATYLNMWSERTETAWSSHVVESLWEQGSEVLSQGLFFFRRCRIVTLVAEIVKCKIYFVCYSSVAHDELNAIYRKRYASPQNHIFAPKIIGSNKQRKRPGENFESEYNNLLKNNWLSGIMYA